MPLPHPAIILDDCPQLLSVIEGMEMTLRLRFHPDRHPYPLPDDAVWREDLPLPLRIRLAKATGATDAQVAEMRAADPEGH